MDIALLNRGWNRTWSDTMVNLEAETSRNSKPAVSILFARWDNTYQVCRRDKAGRRERI